MCIVSDQVSQKKVRYFKGPKGAVKTVPGNTSCRRGSPPERATLAHHGCLSEADQDEPGKVGILL